MVTRAARTLRAFVAWVPKAGLGENALSIR